MFPCFQHPGKQIVHFPFADIVLTLIYFCQCGGHHEVFIQAEVLVEVFVGFTIVVVRCLELIGKSFQQTGIQADVHVEALVVIAVHVLAKFKIGGGPVGRNETAGVGVGVFVVTSVHRGDQANLLEVVHAFGVLRGGTRLRQRGQQHAGQNCDDRDDDQQFDQGECGGGILAFHGMVLLFGLVDGGRSNLWIIHFGTVSIKSEKSPVLGTILIIVKSRQKSSDSSLDSDNSNNGRWTKEEQSRFAEAVLKYGNDWKNIQSFVSTRNITQVRSHAQKFLMKLKESSFLKDKGLNTNLSWTKVINFLNNNLTNDELKEVLFSVEQTGHKKMETKSHKNLKKIQKKSVNKKCNLDEEDETNSKIMDDTYSQNDNLYYSKYNNCAKNYLCEENVYNMKQKIRKQEDEEILQKFIDCFNNSYGENTQNSSFEENSIKEDGNDNRFNFLNEIQNK